MLVPISWLKEYVDLPDEIDVFCEKMIMSGSNVEALEFFGKGISGVKIGQIISIEKHPKADKLVLCTLDINEEKPVQIITGAPNVFVGALVPVAGDGAQIPGPLHGQQKKEEGETIRKGEVRGLLSEGMLCSCMELGFPDKVVPTSHKEGIWILNNEDGTLEIGMDLLDALDLAETVVEFEITPNRPDCLSITGIARECGATFETLLNYPDRTLKAKEGDSRDYLDIEIVRPDLCRRYFAQVVTDVKVKESPWWLQRKLMMAGMRPINNIVDITNYVMLEFGEPIHAFDIRQIQGQKIIVDTASEKEKFISLDGSERSMPNDTLMIKDEYKSVAIAGIMGGLNSEIVEDTETVLIEAANFNPDSVRLSSKKLGLRTEASSRFEKGVAPELCQVAIERVCNLIELLGAGKVLAKGLDAYPNPHVPLKTEIRPERISQLMGLELSADEIEKILVKLEIKVERKNSNLLVTPPSVRQDLLKEIDYVEEVARIYGYDKLALTVPKGNTIAIKSEKRKLLDYSKEVLCALGLNEIQSYSFVSPKTVDKVRIGEGAGERDFIKLINPLGEENSVMRTILLANVMEVLSLNNNRNIEKIGIFEIGNVFGKSKDSYEKQGASPALEKISLALASYGKEENFYTIKGILTGLFAKLGIKDADFARETNNATYHPGRCAKIFIKGKEAGTIGEFHPKVLEAFDIEQRVFGGEIDFDLVIDNADTMRYFSQLAKYPAIERDIALLVEEDTQVRDLLKTIEETGTKILEKVELFDVYRGQQVGEKKKSCAFNLIYRDKAKTLTEEEVERVHENVLRVLEEKHGAKLREI